MSLFAFGTLSGIHFTPHDGFTTSSSLRIPIASTSYAKLPLRVSFVTASGIIVCPSCVHRVSIGRLRTCFGSTLAFNQIRDENRAKLKISYSCGHRVSKSARYDATLKKMRANELAECVNLTEIMDFKQEIRDFSYETSPGEKI